MLGMSWAELSVESLETLWAGESVGLMAFLKVEQWAAVKDVMTVERKVVTRAAYLVATTACSMAEMSAASMAASMAVLMVGLMASVMVGKTVDQRAALTADQLVEM